MKRRRYIVYFLALGLSALAVSVSAIAVALAQPPVAGTQAAGAEVACAEVAGGEVAGTERATVGLPTVTASADFTVVYADLGQLKKAATVIVRGEVIQVAYLDFNSTAYTNVTFRVSKCLKGDIAPGDEIAIAEVGGVTSMATVDGDRYGPPTAKDAETKVSVLLDGAPLSEIGDECLYFLALGSIGVVPGTYYVPLGAFQGRFKTQGALAERFVPVGWGAGYTSLPMVESAIDQTVLRAALDR
jgi:hypothetical protein